MAELALPRRTDFLGRRGPGKISAAAERAYLSLVKAFCESLIEIQSTLDFKVSARGWGYILENKGVITKAELGEAEGLIAVWRKDGNLPVDFCAEDETRAAENLEFVDTNTVEEEAAYIVERMREAHSSYGPFSFWDYQENYVELMVEKIDLKSLFLPECERYSVALTNLKGAWDINSRANMMKRFSKWEAEGKSCVLLYCGDHDPAGLQISDVLRDNLTAMQDAVGWDPSALTIERFGLNADFIEANGLTWVDNLLTGSGKDLAQNHNQPGPKHTDYWKPHVQDYLKQHGVRKLEANALVVRPEAGRALCRRAIEQYIDRNGVRDWEEEVEAEQEKVRVAVLRLLSQV